MPTTAGIHDPAQTSAPPDFLSLFSPNQKQLISQLFRAAASQRGVSSPSAVLRSVYGELAKRTLRNLGQSEGEAYADSLSVIADNDAEARQLAEAVLKAVGKMKGGVR